MKLHALSVRSDFSIGESTLQIDAVVKQAQTLGYEAVALVDTMSISAMVSFTDKCRKEGIKPIIGCTLRVYDDPTYRAPKKGEDGEVKENRCFHLKAFVQTDEGLTSLIKLLTKGASKENFYYHARVGIKDVLDLRGCAISSGDIFPLWTHPEAHTIADMLLERFGADFYVELVPIDSPLYDTLNLRALRWTEEGEYQTLVTYPAFYEKGAADTLDVLRAICTNRKMDSRTLPIPYTRDFAFEPPSELVKRVSAMKQRLLEDGFAAGDALKRGLLAHEQLVGSCSFEFKKLPPSLPKIAKDEFAELLHLSKEGWKERFSAPVLGHTPTDLDVYRQRLAYELGVLRKMNFSGYFLLVRDIVQWAKKSEILVGPGRGSVGGSLVAYLLGITDVDPIRFELLFERFINPERIDLPDADLDFMSTRRHEVIAYITKRYGEDYVAGVSNYNALGPASAIRDVSRVHGLQPFDYSCSKEVEKEHGVNLGLKESLSRVPAIERFAAEQPKVWKHAVGLEGVMRGLGQHAAGVVVAGEPLINRAIVETRTESRVVNWDKKYVEDWGLIKMDILGLSTLDTLGEARRYIKERHGVDVDYLRLPLDDAKVLEAFGAGETVGVFQFESSGMRKLLKDLRVGGELSFDDIAATTALFRPGPLDAGLCDDYVTVKQGTRMPYYEHPSMRRALTSTYGVIVYQEQVMQVCQDLCGFLMAEADHIRKAMGKKDAAKMKEWGDRFIDGAVTRSGMNRTAAEMLWDKIVGFAGYAFNRSHAVEYSVISYWALWVKVNYPAEFYAASMTILKDEEKVASLVIDAKRAGVLVQPPDVNGSTSRIEIRDDKTLLAPFQAVKGISQATAKNIMILRNLVGGQFTDPEQMEPSVQTKHWGRVRITSAHWANLERVGGMYSMVGGKEPLHLDRLKDRLELMPGFTVDAVKAKRGLETDKSAMSQIVRMFHNEIKNCEKCSLKDSGHPLSRFGKTPKFMVVHDSPHWKEAKSGKMLEGEGSDLLKAAFKDAGLAINDGYYTSLVKAPRATGAKVLSNEQINGCSDYLRREIEILKPPVILALGSNAIRYFAPGIKGQPSDLAGKTIFDPKLNASIVFGINPGSVYFDPSKSKLLMLAVEKVTELIVS
jgi:DNA polymerase III subunit alpha